MGKSVEDEGRYRACGECTRVCQTTHGEGLPRSVPRFSRPVLDYALPSATDCNMQIPAFYFRKHMPKGRGNYILVGVTGVEWVVTFDNMALKDGWKAFATDYRLEKGDLVMFALVAPKRFYVNVFDGFGMEKVSTREPPVNSKGSQSTVVISKASRLGPRNESPVSNSAGGTPQETPTPQALRPNAVHAPGNLSPEQNGNHHDEELSPLSRKRPRGDNGETLFEEPSCGDPMVAVPNEDNVALDVGHVDLCNGVQPEPEAAVGQMTPPSDQRQNEATETARGEDPVMNGAGTTQGGSEPQPDHVFEPGVVKQEPDLRVAEPRRTCKNCEQCGLPRTAKTAMQPRALKSEPVTSESPGTPEIRSPSSWTGRVTEDQKQRALIAAKDLSATTTNRHAIVVMRVSFDEKTYDCFVSLKCAEMLPSEGAELSLLDSKGVARKASWNADRRVLQGPGWREFVDAHKLQLDDVFVLEVLESSEQRFVVLVHIFHAHEMENLPVPAVTRYVQASPAPGYVPATPAGAAKTRSSNMLHGFSPLSPTRRKKAPPDVDGAVRAELPRSRASPDHARAATRELPKPATTRKPRIPSPSTPGRVRAAAVTLSPPNKRMKVVAAPNAHRAVVRTELPRSPPVTSTARVDAELPGSSIMTRPRRQSSSPLKPATLSLASVPTTASLASVPTTASLASVRKSDTGDEPSRDVVHESARVAVKVELAKLGGRAKQKAVRERAKLYTPHERRKDEPKASKATVQQLQQHRRTDGPEKQVRTRNSRKVHYSVAKLLDRRKSVQGDVSFLVELEEPVKRSSIHKSMKAKQDAQGRWWVPHHHFTQDFNSCFLA